MSFLVKNFLGAAAPTPAGAEVAHNPHQQTVVTTLINRVSSSTVPQDRRDALSDLCAVEDAGKQMTSDNVALLVNVTKMHLDDPEFLIKAVELFSNISDEAQVPDYGQRASFLDEMMNVELFLTILQDGHFWAKYNAVQVLQRLQMHDDSALVKQLLNQRGVQPLIDVLNDGSNGGALRNEGLVLLSNLTMTNQEVQTILAFENCFDSLFNIIEEEGGVDGDIIVKDCLMVMQNMLRSNKSAEKLFLEMSVARLTSLLRDTTPDGGVLSPNGNGIVHYAIVVASSVLRCADANGDAAFARQALCRSGVFAAMFTVAFSPNTLEAHVVIEALRTIATVLSQNKGACDIFLNAKLKIKQAQLVPVPWLALKVLLYDGDDQAKQYAALHIISAFLNDGGANAAAFMTKGLVPHSKRGVEHGLMCGQLLGGCLFSPNPSSGSTTYYAAWVLSRCVCIPQVAEQLLHISWENNMTFFTAYVHHVVSTIQHHQADLATISMMTRPLFCWVSYTGSATVMLLSDPAQHKFFADWAGQSRDPAHVKLLCAIFHAHLANVCPTTKQSTMQLAREDLVEYFKLRVGTQKLTALVYDVSSTGEWQGAPSEVTNSQTATIYDVPFKKFLTDTADTWKTCFMEDETAPATTAEEPKEVEPTPQPPVESTSAVAETVPPPVQQEPRTSPSPQPAAEAEPTMNGHSTTPPKENGVHVDSAEMQQLLQKLADYEAKMAKLEESVTEERQGKAKLVEELEETKHRAEEQERLFEETLGQKEGEMKELVHSMTMLETQLQTRNEINQSIMNLEAENGKLKVDREELLILVAEIDEENQLLRQAHDSSRISVDGIEHSAEKSLAKDDCEEESLL